MNWNLMRRSLNQRCAFLVSKLFFVPNIWMFMRGSLACVACLPRIMREKLPGV